ncbi:MAG: HAMP domain-containing protein, partial [Anaerolineae bacterium]|nr:HAMP domain-containing protein [Anaerolineae bacterium]
MRLTIGAKLGLGFLIMLLLVAAAGSASIIAVKRLADLTAIMAQDSDEVRRITDIRVSVAEADVALEKAAADGTEGEIATARFWQSKLQEEVTAYLESKGTGSSEAEMLQRLKIAQQNFDETFERYLNLAVLSASLEPRALSQRRELAVDPYLSILTEIESGATNRMVKALNEIQRAQSSLMMMMIGFTVIAALLGAGLAVGITRSVTRPVRRLVEVADNISMGDLDMPVEVTSRDEIGEL